MKKILTAMFVLLISFSFLVCCVKKEDNFSINTKDEKNLNVVLNNVNKGVSKSTEITIEKEETFSITVNLEGDSGVNFKLYRVGNSDEPALDDNMYKESNITTEGLEEGKYTIYFESLGDNLTGTIEVSIK